MLKKNALAVLTCSLFLACSDSGGGGSTPNNDAGTGGDSGGGNDSGQQVNNPDPGTFSGSSPTGKATLSGIIRQSTGNALPGVHVTLDGTTLESVTDTNGQFIFAEVPFGTYMVHLDATGASGDPDTRYGTLAALADVRSAVAELPQVIVLPNLDNVMAAEEMVSVDGSGLSTAAIAATNTDGSIQLDGAMGTQILLDGVPATAPVPVAAVPVPLKDLPMPIETADNSVNIGDFVTIQPPNAQFNPPLDLTIPNTQGLAPNTADIAIFSYDHDLEAWVNRSLETGNYGTVDGTGAFIFAPGVITKGGWHGGRGAPPRPPTTAEGRVIDGAGAPIEGVYVFTNSGQSGRTDAAGAFSVEGVTTDPVVVDVTAPVHLGGTQASASEAHVANGVTAFGDITLALPTVGSLAGVALDQAGPSTAPVTVTGPDSFSTTLTPLAADGSFFATNLAPGDYSASTTFSGAAEATSVNFTVQASQTTAILLERQVAGGQIEVHVFTSPPPGSGSAGDAERANDTDRKATVTVVDATGQARTQTTNANGFASFSNIVTPFSATAQLDMDEDGNLLRVGSTVFLENAPGGRVGIPLFAGGDSADSIAPNTGNALIYGTLTNVPDVPDEFSLVFISEPGGEQTLITGPATNNADIPFQLGLPAGTYRVRFDLVKGRAGFGEVDGEGGGTGGDFADFVQSTVFPTPVVLADNGEYNFGNIVLGDPGTTTLFSTVPLQLNNLLPDARHVEIEAHFRNLTDYSTSFRTVLADDRGGSLTLPANVSLPTSVPPGSSVQYDIEVEGADGVDQSYEGPMVSSLTGTFDLVQPPSSTFGSAGFVSFADLTSSPIAWTAGAGGADLFLANFRSAGGQLDGGDKEFAGSFWFFFIPTNMTSLTLPAGVLPMFQDQQWAEFSLQQVKFGAAYNHAFSFGTDVATNIDSLVQSGVASAERNGTVCIGASVSDCVGPDDGGGGGQQCIPCGEGGERQACGEQICDGVDDCPGGEDEVDCGDGGGGGGVVPECQMCPGTQIEVCASQVCDGVNDCPNGEDEDPQLFGCDTGTSTGGDGGGDGGGECGVCADGQTQLCPEDICNGVTDCPQGEDEDPQVCGS